MFGLWSAEVPAGHPSKQAVDNSTAVVFAKDREGRYLFVNRVYERLMER
jgi:PAS domain-containing protein